MRRTRALGSRLGAGLVAGVLAFTLAPAVPGPSSAAPGDTAAPDEPGFEQAAEQAPRQSAAARRAAAGVDAARVPTLRWGRCERGLRTPRSRCSTVRVPLDYDRPRGATTELALLKYRAAKPRARVGSLFVNPGGPGGDGRSFALFAGPALGAAIDRRFDIIGIDPRGVGGSGTSRCAGGPGLGPYSRFGYPITGPQVRQQIRHDRALRQICRQGASRIVDHASTADNARDLELVRRALGQGRLNYYGVSYGSYLGQTYAALFPGNIRALTIDGILDPVAWSTGPSSRPVLPFTYRLRSGEGAYRALTSAFAECDRVGRERCALAPSSATQWRGLLADARSGDLVVPGSDGFPDQSVSEQDLISTTLGVLYSARSIKPYFRELAMMADGAGGADQRGDTASAAEWDRFQRLREARDAGPYSLVRPGWKARSPEQPSTEAPRRVAFTAFEAVACSDTRNPRQPYAWERAARLTRNQAWFGRLWTWASSSCAERGIGDGSDSFRGPWATRTSAPLLIVGNEYDPATPISGARRAHREFAGSSLLYYPGYGHGNLGDSRCVTRAYEQYFVNRRIVRDGSTCQPDRPLFP